MTLHMPYGQYGVDGPLISRLGFGVMRLPLRRPGKWGEVDGAASTALIRAALEGGVNFVDSHHRYHEGNSEVAIGRALRGWTGHRVYIQTKTPWYDEKPTKHFEKLLHEALEKLGVDCIDYLLTHALSLKAWKARGKAFIRFSDWALRRGLIRHRGFSSHETPANLRAFINTGEFSAMLVSYNWMNPEVRDVIAYAAERGMGVSVMNPVGGGALATTTPQILRLLPGAATAAEIALRYVWDTPGVTCALSGMNAPAQLRENLAVAGRAVMIGAAEGRRMRARLARIEAAAKRFCTACGYCRPCRRGVDIPGNFKLLNQARFFGRTEWARQQYAALKKHKDGDQSAEACRQCGACEPRCPHGVPIIRQLQQVQRLLG